MRDPHLAHRLEQRDRAAQVVRPVLGRVRHRLADQRLGGEVQHRLDAVGQHLGGAVAQRALDERGAGRHRVGVPGGQVVEHGDLVPGRDQLRGDDAADVSGTAGDEHSHEQASLSRCAASSGTMSLIHTPMPGFRPGQVLQLAGRTPDRQYLKVRRELAARGLVPDRRLVPRGDVRSGPAEQPVEPPQHVQVQRPERLARRLAERGQVRHPGDGEDPDLVRPARRLGHERHPVLVAGHDPRPGPQLGGDQVVEQVPAPRTRAPAPPSARSRGATNGKA